MRGLLVALSLLLCGPSSAQFSMIMVNGGAGAAPSFTPQWSVAKIGAGGQSTALYAYPDGTVISRHDTYNAYVRATSGSCAYGATVYAAPCWRGVVTSTSMPASAVSIDLANGNGGVAEIIACPSNTSVMYMIWQHLVYVSTDKGLHWIATTQASGFDPNNSSQKSSGPYIACDPNTPDTVLVATPSSGVFKSTNGTLGGSATWTGPIATVGSGGSGLGNTIAYVPGSSTNIMICTYGTGCFTSTNGTTYTAVSATNQPTNFSHAYACKFGDYWVVNNGSNILYRYVGTTWTQIQPDGGGGQVAGFACDPAASSQATQRVIVSNFNGQINISTNNGGAWGATQTDETLAATAAQPAWILNSNQNQGIAGTFLLNSYSIAFDASGNLWQNGGLCNYFTSPTITQSHTVWNIDCLGIEQLVTRQIASPPGALPSIAFWDKGVFQFANVDVFPSTYWPAALTYSPIMLGYSVDWASSKPTFLTNYNRSNISSSQITNGDASSSDGGKTWTTWSGTAGSNSPFGGAIAASTDQNWLLVPAANAGLFFTNNGGGSFTASTISGSPTNWLTAAFVGYGWPIAADRVAPSTYCAVTTGQVFYSSTNGGSSFAATGATSANIDGSPNEFFLQSYPGASGTYFYTAGGQGGTHPTATHLWKSTNTCAGWAITNANLKEVIAFGFGAPAPGSSNYTIYTYGWLNGTLGFEQSTDGGTTLTPINVPASETPWPLGSIDLINYMSGDSNVYGRILVGWSGSGAAYIDTADACPYVSFSNVAPGAALTGASVTLTAKHSGLAPVAGVNFYVDGAQIGATQTGAGPYSVSFNASGQTIGAHTLKVLAIGSTNAGCSASLSSGNSFSMPITTSFLAGRDLDPANDNTPMELNAVA